ncbi:MAG: pseudouridine synthase, partial [Eubacteriales bacterium]|nr:pseudouridine synthase [Eubacteriales bacterium]
DKDSEGLILMTNNGEIMDKILRSVNGHEKEYVVTVNKTIDESFIKRMSGGIYLRELDRTTNKCLAEKLSDKTFRIILTQGLNRQIRRMCAACGFKVIKLKRIRIMNIELGDLKTGGYRDVTKEEYEKLIYMLNK